MTGQKNDGCRERSAGGCLAPSAAESFFRPDLAIPCQVASQQSLTPPDQAPASIYQGDVQIRFDHGCSIRPANRRIEIPPVGVNSSSSVDTAAEAALYDAVNGVAPTARNSHQTNQHLPRRGRAAHGERDRRLAKECVGSNRPEKNDRNFPQRRRP